MPVCEKQKQNENNKQGSKQIWAENEQKKNKITRRQIKTGIV